MPLAGRRNCALVTGRPQSQLSRASSAVNLSASTMMYRSSRSFSASFSSPLSSLTLLLRHSLSSVSVIGFDEHSSAWSGVVSPSCISGGVVSSDSRLMSRTGAPIPSARRDADERRKLWHRVGCSCFLDVEHSSIWPGVASFVEANISVLSSDSSHTSTGLDDFGLKVFVWFRILRVKEHSSFWSDVGSACRRAVMTTPPSDKIR